jgi:hypothetical protein
MFVKVRPIVAILGLLIGACQVSGSDSDLGSTDVVVSTTTAAAVPVTTVADELSVPPTSATDRSWPGGPVVEMSPFDDGEQPEISEPAPAQIEMCGVAPRPMQLHGLGLDGASQWNIRLPWSESGHGVVTGNGVVYVDSDGGDSRVISIGLDGVPRWESSITWHALGDVAAVGDLLVLLVQSAGEGDTSGGVRRSTALTETWSGPLPSTVHHCRGPTVLPHGVTS